MQSALNAIAPGAPARDDSGTLAVSIRRSEWVVLAFLFYAQALAHLPPVSTAVQYRISVWNPATAVAYAVLLYVDSVNPTLSAGIVRDWLPLALIVLAYREMGWLATGHACDAGVTATCPTCDLRRSNC